MDIYSLENHVSTDLEIQRENTIQLIIGNQDFTLRFVILSVIILLYIHIKEKLDFNYYPSPFYV